MPSEVTTIVLFDVPAEHAERFLAMWNESNAFMGAQPGLIEGTLYRATSDGAPYRYVNVARWTSEEALAAARQAHATHQAMEGKDQRKDWAALGIGVTPASYAAEVSYPGRGLD